MTAGRDPGASPPRPSDRWDDWADIRLDGDEPSRGPLFHGADIYRRRRIMDAARLLPALGTVFLMMPILWARDHGTAIGAIYLFSVWFGLILAAAVISRRLSEPLRDHRRKQEGPD